MKTILSTIKERSKGFNVKVYPSFNNTFKAFKYPMDSIKVVIIGQDPYHTEGMATGLAFANPNSYGYTELQPSLKNIINELEYEYDVVILNPESELSSWATQGVFLFNTALTVERASPGSHSLLWKPFTYEVIKSLEENIKPIYLLLGKHAENTVQPFNIPDERKVITSHPSPLSAYRGFKGSGVFKKVNKRLEEKGILPINWLSIMK
jgi:uracil-DNA glycosylase